jgi:hypothetical protein
MQKPAGASATQREPADGASRIAKPNNAGVVTGTTLRLPTVGVNARGLPSRACPALRKETSLVHDVLALAMAFVAGARFSISVKATLGRGKKHK